MLQQYQELTQDTEYTSSFLTSDLHQLKIDLSKIIQCAVKQQGFADLAQHFVLNVNDKTMIYQLINVQLLNQDEYSCYTPQQSQFVASDEIQNQEVPSISETIYQLIFNRQLNILGIVLIENKNNLQQILNDYKHYKKESLLKSIWKRDGLMVYLTYKKYLQIIQLDLNQDTQQQL